ncbi:MULTISPECIES: flagellar assembly protein FliW [unclassified Sporosarcina]|uniref:flagellar assembly protein FliW n=1 Tax=unclassified Sporosarcina TaxID=2647733 RepID=UPI00203EC9B1|nr:MULTISPECIES: flagellar assembly protein FliW [unclassified Sporosarcina]GKV64865.1 flagellar assembly factor FliW [Sporosarcina sp. NCCP-2331]GLB54975.1 flagellar assembly factor FliW [Sporosarcina sp. NCCP-2378]
MQIQTKFHGNIQIEPTETWHFPKGLPGFEEETEFTLLPIEGNNAFQVLQSTNQANTAFIVANPYTLTDNYSFEIDEPTINSLEITKPEDVMVLGILSMKQPFDQSTINLQAPLVFQLHNKKAKQMILNDNRFEVRHQIGKGGN